MPTIKVLIIDDYALLRAALKTVLSSEEDITIIGETYSCDEASAILAQNTPDIAFLNLLKPNVDALNLVKKARKNNLGTRFIAFTNGDLSTAQRAFFELKIAGLLCIDSGFEEVKLAVRNVYKGDTYVDPRIAQALFGRVGRKRANTLSSRQLQVLKMIADGFTNKRISAELGISQDTVKTHVRIILKKLGAADRAQAVARAFESDLLSTNDG